MKDVVVVLCGKSLVGHGGVPVLITYAVPVMGNEVDRVLEDCLWADFVATVSNMDAIACTKYGSSRPCSRAEVDVMVSSYGGLTKWHTAVHVYKGEITLADVESPMVPALLNTILVLEDGRWADVVGNCPNPLAILYTAALLGYAATHDTHVRIVYTGDYFKPTNNAKILAFSIFHKPKERLMISLNVWGERTRAGTLQAVANIKGPVVEAQSPAGVAFARVWLAPFARGELDVGLEHRLHSIRLHGEVMGRAEYGGIGITDVVVGFGEAVHVIRHDSDSVAPGALYYYYTSYGPLAQLALRPASVIEPKHVPA